MDDEFQVWLGHVGKERPMRQDLHRAINQASGGRRSAGKGRSQFTGNRIGRGGALGRMLGGSGYGDAARARRVIVKARFVKLAGKGMKAAVAHLSYLQRDGTTREGERGALYGRDTDIADGKAFLERGAGDRHQFRFIVAPEDGAQYEDLKPLTRRLMQDMERDLGTSLEWVAVDHFNTGHPHTHIAIRGIDDRGKDLIIARDYISRGIAARASDIVTRDLGPRSELEIREARRAEIAAERFTKIDRTLVRDLDDKGLAPAWHRDPMEQSLRAARLGTLSRMGLAVEEENGRYRLDPDLEQNLRAIGRRGDIIATMHEKLRSRPGILPQDYAIHDPDKDGAIVGRVVGRGLSDEHRDRHYMIVEATDGRSHYVDLGHELADGAMRDRLVRVTEAAVGVRKADRTIDEIARVSDGAYSSVHHGLYDQRASRTLIEAHVRRLEALRRGGIAMERRADGAWKIPGDYIEQVREYEQRQARLRPVQVQVLAEQPLERLARHDGPTWLDEQCLSREPESLKGHLGGEVRTALQQRRQWLIEQGLAEQEGNTIRYQANLMANLRQRELRRVAGQLSEELGLNYVPGRDGQIEGTLRRAVQVGGEKFAVVEKSKEFTLVPWRPVLEKQIGRYISGIQREGTINWTFGRGRGPEIDF